MATSAAETAALADDTTAAKQCRSPSLEQLLSIQTYRLLSAVPHFVAPWPVNLSTLLVFEQCIQLEALHKRLNTMDHCIRSNVVDRDDSG